MLKKIVKDLKPSSTLKINEISRKLEDKGKKIFKFGFGQSPFQIPTDIINALTISFGTWNGDWPNPNLNIFSPLSSSFLEISLIFKVEDGSRPLTIFFNI